MKTYITWTCFKENAKVIMNVLYIVKTIIPTITPITYKEKNTFLGYLRQSYIIWATLSSKVSWLSKSLYVQESWKEIHTHYIYILYSHNIYIIYIQFIYYTLKKTLMLGKIKSRRRRGDRGWDGSIASPTHARECEQALRDNEGQGSL